MGRPDLSLVINQFVVIFDYQVHRQDGFPISEWIFKYRKLFLKYRLLNKFLCRDNNININNVLSADADVNNNVDLFYFHFDSWPLSARSD